MISAKSFNMATTGTNNYINFLKAIIESNNDPIVAFDLSFNCLLANPSYQNTFLIYYEKEIQAGDYLPDKLTNSSGDRKVVLKQWKKALEGYSFTDERALTNLEGSPQYYEVTFYPLRNDRNTIYGAVGIYKDVSRVKRQKRRIQKLLQDEMRLNRVLLKKNLQLEKKEEKLLKDNQFLTQYKKELVEELKLLEDRNFELDQLIYKTSHDIRSPLTSILGLINIIRLEDDQAKRDGYVNFIEERVNKLDNFLQSMLNYAKATRKDAEPDEVNFEELINKCLDDLKYRPGYDEIKKEIQLPEHPYKFSTDTLKLEIILNNLLSNAVKYQDTNKENKLLKISIKMVQKGVRIVIEDNGIGMDEAFAQKVYDMFSRNTEQAEGSGLGMYIVKQTVDKLGGSILLESQEGTGTTFTLFLPNRN